MRLRAVFLLSPLRQIWPKAHLPKGALLEQLAIAQSVSMAVRRSIRIASYPTT
jgi:hypothetical protein